MLKAGIVGLPNVGKSTLFNALIHARKAAAENFPFCTIDPNLGVVNLPDPRLPSLARLARVDKIIPTAIEFVDIAGLVQGASKGEGLGNQFLSHIREVDALIQVVRCFEDEDVHHVTGSLDPTRDIGIVATELILADLDSLRKREEKLGRDLKRHDKHAEAEEGVLKKIIQHLDAGRPANTLALHHEEKTLASTVPLLTDKPTLFAANVAEGDLGLLDQNAHVARVRDYARAHHACETVALSAKLESDLIDLSAEEAAEYLRELGVRESGVDALIHATYLLLNLRTFFTFNETEVRAWTVHGGDTAPKAAGRIHTDFERGFIKAETVRLTDLEACGSVAHARERGLYRMEGKDYVVQDGDVMHFKFHV
jgi:ribosome-binding ATPase